MTTTTAHDHRSEPDDFDRLVDLCRAWFTEASNAHQTPLFTTDVDGLFGTYLEGLGEERALHDCHACRSFFRRYGSLAYIGEDGSLVPAMWPDREVPAIYRDAVLAIRNRISRAKVTGVFCSSDREWGTQVAGGWTHLAQSPDKRLVYTGKAKTAGEVMAQSREDFRTLSHALGEYSGHLLREAKNLLGSDAMFRSEKVIGVAYWLADLKEKREAYRGRDRDNITWRAVATAPAGFCQPRSSMIGTLLDDLASGLSTDAVVKRFKAKMDPLLYQRPQLAPKAGNIARGEALIEKMGLAPSLQRRYARLDEVKTIWTPAPTEEPKATGVFAKVKPRGEEQKIGRIAPPTTMTFAKFRREVLPNALKIEYVPTSGYSTYCGLLTAVHADAPPILQWDSADPEARNPVNWYVYNGGSPASAWGLIPGIAVDVTGICLKPSMWAGEELNKHQGTGALFILDGAKDQRLPGLCLFPEVLRATLHEVRATIEAFSKANHPEGADQASANGILIGSSRDEQATFVVTTRDGTARYKIDRWD